MHIKIEEENNELVFVVDEPKKLKHKIQYSEGVKKLRKHLGLNTQNFGKLCGVSGRTVEGYEQGLKKPSRSVLMHMEKLI